jgi:hypothetical protein
MRASAAAAALASTAVVACTRAEAPGSRTGIEVPGDQCRNGSLGLPGTGDGGLASAACYEDLGDERRAMHAYRRAAATAVTIAVRKQALLGMARLGENVALPESGTCRSLETAPGCRLAYHACMLDWRCSGNCWESHGVALQIFSFAKPSSPEEHDTCDFVPAGPDDDSTELATQVEASPPFFYSIPGSVILDLDSEQSSASSREVCLGSDRDDAEPVVRESCKVVVADACRGRIGLVCAHGNENGTVHRSAGEFWLQPASE